MGQQVALLHAVILELRLPHAVTLPSSNSVLNSMLPIPTTGNGRERAWPGPGIATQLSLTVHSGKLMTVFYLNAREL